MNWEGKNILITGSTGFVGFWLTKKLIEEKANVISIVRDQVPESPFFFTGLSKMVKVINGDIIDFNLVNRVFNEYEIDSCFHLAAQPIVTIANRSPIPTFETNIKGTWNILEVGRTCGTLERMVIASTDKVYGEPIKLPIEEDHPLLAIYPYDASKSCLDILSRTYAKTYGLPIGVTRCCNIYGGGDINFTRIIPGTIKSVLLGKSPVIRSDGTPIRDFIYVDDAVEAYLTIAENLNREEIKGEAFNFGSNSPISVLDSVKKIIKISGKKLEPEILGKSNPKGEIDRQYLSSKKAEKLLGWKPKVNLEEGLKRTIKWYQDFFNHFFNHPKVSS